MEIGKFHNKNLVFSVTIVAFLIAGKCSASCYFSPELQGSFVTQGTIADNRIQYSQINITEDSIPIWGICHKRVDNNVILMISSDETTCYRCFNLKLVSRNILRVCTTDPDYISKCYANEEKAQASCPTESNLNDPSSYTEIILYKNLEIDGQEIRREYCPINGRYKLNYNNDDGQEDLMECSTLESELDNCPSGSAMNLRFKKCSFENHEITFECLGHWEGYNKQKYLALMKPNLEEDKLGPQYRCAIYEENPESGMITLSFSRDSTCSAINKPIIQKQKTMRPNMKADVPHTETLTLYLTETSSWPHTNFCQYPEWMQGHWQHLTVTNDTLIFRDQTSFKAYTMKCVENLTDSILVFSRTQCDEEIYQCIQIKYRSSNIIEFQIGSKLSSNYSHSICSKEYFDDNRWLTQGRLDYDYLYSPCPVNGEFTGMIPDAVNLCAKLSSECSSEDVMYYEVSACDYGEVYEERKYRCLGQWEENGLVYTYTKRLDVGTYECFVGAMMSEKQVFIKEAGEHCQRNVNPYRYGMELNKIAYCKHDSTRRNDNSSMANKSSQDKSLETSATPSKSTFSTVATDIPAKNIIKSDIPSTTTEKTANIPKVKSQGNSFMKIRYIKNILIIVISISFMYLV